MSRVQQIITWLLYSTRRGKFSSSQNKYPHLFHGSHPRQLQTKTMPLPNNTITIDCLPQNHVSLIGSDNCSARTRSLNLIRPSGDEMLLLTLSQNHCYTLSARMTHWFTHSLSLVPDKNTEQVLSFLYAAVTTFGRFECGKNLRSCTCAWLNGCEVSARLIRLPADVRNSGRCLHWERRSMDLSIRARRPVTLTQTDTLPWQKEHQWKVLGPKN